MDCRATCHSRLHIANSVRLSDAGTAFSNIVGIENQRTRYFTTVIRLCLEQHALRRGGNNNRNCVGFCDRPWPTVSACKWADSNLTSRVCITWDSACGWDLRNAVSDG